MLGDGPCAPVESGAAAFGGRVGLGRRPALLIVDMSLGFTAPDAPLACDAAGAVEAVAGLLARARQSGVPVMFTTVAYRTADVEAAAAFLDKVPALRRLAHGSRWVEIDPRIAPAADEPVLTKHFASAFFGTDLVDRLRASSVDSVLVAGASTSGCVRATVVDALQHGFRPVVAREAVADRDRAAHDQSLTDIDAKYGDVVALERALEWLGGDLGDSPRTRGADT
jgi:nicotinamidase-related amidase